MGTPRVLLYGTGGSIAFRVSKPGCSIWSSNPDDYLLNEGAPQAVMIALYHVLTLTRTAAKVCTWQTAHGFPFTPAIAPMSFLIASENGASVWVDETNVYMQVYTTSDIGSLTLAAGFPIGLFSVTIQ